MFSRHALALIASLAGSPLCANATADGAATAPAKLERDAAGALVHQSAFTDFRGEAPGVRRHLTLADLPEPGATGSSNNGPEMVRRPEGAMPRVPPGFKVELAATGLDNPRLIRVAPNGDLFLAESETGKIKVFRGVGGDGKFKQTEIFASGLSQPFGINFYPSGAQPKWLYVGNTDSIVRFPYAAGDLKASGPAEKLAEIPGGGRLRGGGHWTRDLVFSLDGKRMLVSVGSHSNADDADTHPEEFHRADVLEFAPDGKFVKIFASGLRNCVGEAVNPTTGELWCSTNERDGLGDNLVPDYVTHVQEDGFYGWPWFYMGGHQDPRLPGKHPELRAKTITPDILLQPHFASLEMTFYPLEPQANGFPADFRGDGFAAEHGSWNRSERTGYELIRLPMKGGHATGEYEDFLTGFVTPEGNVWGRPVGVAVASDGSLFVSDDGSKSIWHITYSGSSSK